MRGAYNPRGKMKIFSKEELMPATLGECPRMSEDLDMLLVRETWQLSTLLRRFHGTRVWEEG